MKVLVAATCIAVLAAVGYYFFKEYRIAVAVAERQQAIAEATQAEANAKTEAKREASRQPCRRDLDDLQSYDVFAKPNVQWSADYLAIKVRDCVTRGVLSEDEVATVRHRLATQ